MKQNVDISISKFREHDKKFRKCNDTGIDDGGKSYHHMQGNINILVSAPHSVKTYRKTEGKTYAEIFTGSIACYLHELTGCHTIYKKYNDGTNANSDSDEKDGGYKNAVKSIAKKYNIKTLIDLHGMGEDVMGVNTEIVIGTGTKISGDGETASIKTSKKVIEIFKKYEISADVSYGKFNAGHPNNITKYIHNTDPNIESMQFEISAKYLNLDEIKPLMNALVEIINCLNT